MLDAALLRERFEALLAQQRQAEGVYASMTDHANDRARPQLEQIQRDKRKHIQLTERLLEILE